MPNCEYRPVSPVWRGLLRIAAEEGFEDVEAQLFEIVPLRLRDYNSRLDSANGYLGPVPEAIKRFTTQLPLDQRSIVESAASELVDQIIDDVVAGMQKPLLLIKTCHAYPDATIDELVTHYPWEWGLKRSRIWKLRWVTDMLRSMTASGVPLPCTIVNALGDEGEAKYEFNEVRYATSRTRIERTWKDYQRRHGLLRNLPLDELTDGGLLANTIDQNGLRSGRTLSNITDGIDYETKLDLQRAGKQLSRRLTQLLKRLETEEPRRGYGAIAWHNVFWTLNSDYEALQLDLQMQEPFCLTDQKMADLIDSHYPGVKIKSRAAVQRYRRKLQTICEDLILHTLKQRFKAEAAVP